MRHPSEEELIAYRDGAVAQGGVAAGSVAGGEFAPAEVARRETIAEHVKECAGCKAELERIDAVLAALDSMPIPDPGEDYGRRVWLQIAPRLPEKARRWWEFGVSKQPSNAVSDWRSLFEPRRLAALGAIAALVIVAFVAGWLTRTHVGPTPTTADTGKVRERVLILAVGEHLGRSEMVLVELANAEPAQPGAKNVDISTEQRRAEDLLEENRLYRQAALRQGEAGLASVLDELERVLLDVAHSPQEVSTAQLETMRQRIEAKGILFKVRVVGKELQHRGDSATTTPDETGSAKGERKKI
jgi:hypothetical protein